jgi:hypothetical protein
MRNSTLQAVSKKKLDSYSERCANPIAIKTLVPFGGGDPVHCTIILEPVKACVGATSVPAVGTMLTTMSASGRDMTCGTNGVGGGGEEEAATTGGAWWSSSLGQSARQQQQQQRQQHWIKSIYPIM